MPVEEEFSGLVRIARPPGLSQEERAKEIADRIRPTPATETLQMRARLRQWLYEHKRERWSHLTSEQREIFCKAFELTNQRNRPVPHLKLERLDHKQFKYHDVVAFGPVGEMHALIEIALGSDEIILARITRPWGMPSWLGFGRVLSSSDQQVVFAVEERG
jgi:hypothetical protein